jgi:hypothetical protein
MGFAWIVTFVTDLEIATVRSENTHAVQFYFGEWTVLCIDWFSFHEIQRRVFTVNDLAKDGIFTVEMLLLRVRYEKLRFVRVWT